MSKNFKLALGDDNVYTPRSMTSQFLEMEKFHSNKLVLEPACGNFAISRILLERFNNGKVLYFDINREGQYWVDFLDIDKKDFDGISYILTNPPYSKLDKFVQQAKEIADIKFAFLVKLTHLGGVNRFNKKIFLDEKYPLTKIYLFTRQANLRFTNEKQEKGGYIKYRALREDGKYPAGMFYYVWLVWEKAEDQNKISVHPRFFWIDNNNYILKKGEANE